jgi:hypothetical protein
MNEYELLKVAVMQKLAAKDKGMLAKGVQHARIAGKRFMQTLKGRGYDRAKKEGARAGVRARETMRYAGTTRKQQQAAGRKAALDIMTPAKRKMYAARGGVGLAGAAGLYGAHRGLKKLYGSDKK